MRSSKEHILGVIRQMAASNDGVPPGQPRFEKFTGIRAAAWRGTLWKSWSEALQEAGFLPNKPTRRISDRVVLKNLVAAIREFGRFPTSAELQMRSKQDPSFPSRGVIARFGRRPRLLAPVDRLLQRQRGT